MEAPSRHLHESSPGEQVDFGAVRTASSAPRRYDDLELGNCSKFEFRKAMNALWQAKGLPILPSEVEGWASMFDKKRNGADSA